MLLSRPLEKHIEYNGRTYRLNLAFDVVLRVFELQKDWLFTPSQRQQLTIEMLAGRKAAKLPIAQQSELLKQIFETVLNTNKGPSSPGPKTMDFSQDADYIYSSFWQAYGIDLHKEHGRMDWRVFMSLFEGLPEDTKIREVMNIRQRKEPAPSKHNQEEIAALRKAKAYYALKISTEEAEESFQRDLDRFVSSLAGGRKK